MKTENSRIGVISGRYPASVFASHINHKAYCDKFGYTYINCNWPTGASNPYMNKMKFIKAYYHLFEFIFWIDDDAFFMNLDKPLDKFLPSENSFFSVCSSPDYKKISTFISSGQFMLRCNSIGRSFIDSVEVVDLQVVKTWWTDELGYFSNGDQDAMIYLMKTNSKYSSYNLHHYSEFNSRIEDYLSNKEVFILHITGTVKKKLETYKIAKKVTGFGSTLLPVAYQRKLHFSEPKSIIRRLLSRLKSLFLKKQ